MPDLELVDERLTFQPQPLGGARDAAAFGLFFLFLFGLFFVLFFGAIVGAYAISRGRDALVNINVYGVGLEYKWVVRAAQLLGAFSIIWPLALATLLFVGRQR